MSRVGRPTTVSNDEISGDIYTSYRSRRKNVNVDENVRESEREREKSTETRRDRSKPEVKESESKWSPTGDLNATQKRLVLARTLEKSVELVMKHHVYRFGQKIYRQQEGGAIGSRLTGSAACIVMDEWIDDFLQRMEETGYTLHMWKKYVDDINFLIEDPEPDEAWCEDRCRKPGRKPKVVYPAPRPAGSRGWGCPACHMRRDSEVLALVMNVANGIH